MKLSSTHTFVILQISETAFEEIKTKLTEAGYSHTFHENDEYGLVIDMHGIGLASESCETTETALEAKEEHF